MAAGFEEQAMASTKITDPHIEQEFIKAWANSEDGKRWADQLKACVVESTHFAKLLDRDDGRPNLMAHNPYANMTATELADVRRRGLDQVVGRSAEILIVDDPVCDRQPSSEVLILQERVRHRDSVIEYLQKRVAELESQLPPEEQPDQFDPCSEHENVSGAIAMRRDWQWQK